MIASSGRARSVTEVKQRQVEGHTKLITGYVDRVRALLFLEQEDYRDTLGAES